MDRNSGPGPVIVCVEASDDLELLVQSGMGIAQSMNVGLLLVAVLILPAQRPLVLTEMEDQAASRLLDVASKFAAGSGVPVTGEVWLGRSWKQTIQQMVEELSSSAVVIGRRRCGPLNLFDAGSRLLKAISCPVIIVGKHANRKEHRSWPPRWLADVHLDTAE